MNTPDSLLKNPSHIETKLNYTFKDKSLLVLAFIHRSYINEHREILAHNERLEFLGDSILGLLVADYLYHHFPNTPEGELSSLRSRLVEANACGSYIQHLQLEHTIFLGRGEQMNDGRGRESILADLLEAIIGAIYLDGGLEAARQFLFGNFSKEIQHILKTPLQNYKALLQDYCQKKFQRPPTYIVRSESGPDHSKIFLIAVEIDGIELGSGQGTSKKEAQQEAAKAALERIQSQEITNGS